MLALSTDDAIHSANNEALVLAPYGRKPPKSPQIVVLQSMHGLVCQSLRWRASASEHYCSARVSWACQRTLE